MNWFFLHSPDTYLHLRQRKMLLFWKCIKKLICLMLIDIMPYRKMLMSQVQSKEGMMSFRQNNACVSCALSGNDYLFTAVIHTDVSSELVRTRATRDRADSVWFLAFSLSVSLLWCLWERDWEQNARRQCSFSSMSMALFRIWYSHATISVRRMWMWYLHDVQKGNVLWTTYLYTTVRKPYICWFRWSV